MVALSKRPELLKFVKKRARETKAIWCVMQARNGQLMYALAETAVRQTLENPPHTYTYKILDVVYPSGQVEPFDPRYLNWAFQKWAFKHRIQELVDEFIRERESTKDGVEYWDKFLDLDGRQAADEFAIFTLGNNRTKPNQVQNLGALHYDTGAHQVSKCIIKGKLEEGQKHDSILNRTDE